MILIIFILGLVIGSFLNVVIYRVPEGKSIVKPPSHCPECDHRLTPIELIPVISYIILKGKCRSCDTKISLRYPAVELITGIVFVINYLQLYYNLIILLAGLVLSSILIVLTLIDYDHQILPDSITIGGLIIGLILSIFRPDITVINAILGLLVAGGFLLIIAYASKGGLGGGDIKLMAMVGTFLGPLSAFAAIFIGALLGLLASLPGILSGELSRKSKLPFGPFLAGASLIFWFWGDYLWEFYLNIFI